MRSSGTTRPFFATLTDQLVECVEYRITYEMPGPSGESRADTNAKFNQAHKTPDPPELPDEVEHVWQWFWELSAQRRSGPEPIGWDDIGRWASLTGTDPTPEEVSMILAMDAAFRVAVRDLQKGGTKRTKPDAPPKKEFKQIR